ncbi:MAG: hypothetical protein AB7U29_14395 [Desulfobulbus sp.]
MLELQAMGCPTVPSGAVLSPVAGREWFSGVGRGNHNGGVPIRHGAARTQGLIRLDQQDLGPLLHYLFFLGNILLDEKANLGYQESSFPLWEL